MEWKLKPVAPLEETSLGKVPVSPSRTIWPASWTLLFMVGTLPLPQHHHPGLRESARWLLLVSFLSKQSLASPLNPFQDFRELREDHCLGFGASPQGPLQDGGAMAGLNQTQDGRKAWNRPQQLLESVALALPPVLAGTGLLDSMFLHVYLLPLDRLHLTPGLVAHSHRLRSLCRARAG